MMRSAILASVIALPISLAVADNHPTRAFFGDTHLHTSFSPDAGMAGTKVGPNDAYRFVLGETVTSSTGQEATISSPLDFVVIADHAENLGLADAIANADPGLLADPFGKQLYDLVTAGKGIDAFNLLVQQMNKGAEAKIKSESMLRNAWTKIMDLADQYNEPGEFTAFIGYEWTSQPGGNNLHRVVVFRGDKASVDPVLPFSNFDSENVEDLWDYMAAYEKDTGGQVLAIPHNGNLSSGMMFAPQYQTDGKPIDKRYAEARFRWEPIVEVTQAKGTGEAHPFLSPDDEFADFEIVDTTNLGGTAERTTDMIQYEYARPALKMGLEFEESLGANPFKFGMVGSTDSHTGLPATREDVAHLLRQGMQLTGTHVGCDTTSCGACTVLFDGRPVKSCTMLAVQADGHDVETVEGMSSASELHPVQEGFKQEHGLQCGYCTPGMMLTSKALLERNPDPSEDDIRWALSGNLCRCTGYQNIVKSVLWAAEKMRAERGEDA